MDIRCSHGPLHRDAPRRLRLAGFAARHHRECQLRAHRRLLQPVRLPMGILAQPPRFRCDRYLDLREHHAPRGERRRGDVRVLQQRVGTERDDESGRGS